MKDLATFYTLEEARQMYEVLLVAGFNDWLAARKSMEKGGGGRV